MSFSKHELVEVILQFQVGEGERRYSAKCKLNDIGQYLVRAFPLSIREIGGGVDLLLGHEALGKPIEGVFPNFDEARNAVWAWCWAFSASNAERYR